MSPIGNASKTQLRETYSRLSDDSLMQLAIEGGLTEGAEKALSAELQKRSLNTSEINELKDWEIDQANPAPMRRTFWGYGWKFVGRKFLSSSDEADGVFVSTRFVVLMAMPMIPTGSFRVDQKAGGFPQIHSRVAWQMDQIWSGVWPTILLSVAGAAMGFLSAYLTEKSRRGF